MVASEAKRVRISRERHGVADLGENFGKFDRVRQIDEDVLVAYILRNRDIVMDDMTLIKKYDGDALWHILCAGTMVSFNCSLPEELVYLDVWGS